MPAEGSRHSSTPKPAATRTCRAVTRSHGRTRSPIVMRDIYGFIAAGQKPSDKHPPAFATFEDGYRANCIVEAILETRKREPVDRGEVDQNSGSEFRIQIVSHQSEPPLMQAAAHTSREAKPNLAR